MGAGIRFFPDVSPNALGIIFGLHFDGAVPEKICALASDFSNRIQRPGHDPCWENFTGNEDSIFFRYLGRKNTSVKIP